MNAFYLFHLYDTEKNTFISLEDVLSEAKRLSLQMVPLFYEGPYRSTEHLKSFVCQSHFCARREGVGVQKYKKEKGIPGIYQNRGGAFSRNSRTRTQGNCCVTLASSREKKRLQKSESVSFFTS